MGAWLQRIRSGDEISAGDRERAAGCAAHGCCFPRERDLKFRLGILFPAMICRLDYADETHTNSIDGVLLRAVPYAVQGPHYHSWPLNRRFFRGVTLPQTLLDAGPYDAGPYNEPGRTFDAILRWFCADTNIETLPPDHLISLPVPELLL
jgi:hypothetical protein